LSNLKKNDAIGSPHNIDVTFKRYRGTELKWPGRISTLLAIFPLNEALRRPPTRIFGRLRVIRAISVEHQHFRFSLNFGLVAASQ
jgi:hypothetical protein